MGRLDRVKDGSPHVAVRRSALDREELTHTHTHTHRHTTKTFQDAREGLKENRMSMVICFQVNIYVPKIVSYGY